ncbi:MAG: WhiB family transcriptional regulator, partial [Propionibacteriales bacterium]|nr:WhiB family transcriptional regulator [Propionibacteriales bacterium]
PEEDTAPARAVCVRCPVRRSCLAQAILGDEQGLWGGLTRRQRRTAIDHLDPDPDTGARDWSGLLNGLLLRPTLASVPVTAASSDGLSDRQSAGRLGGGSAA